MARPLRFEIPGGCWHTWNRGVNFGDIVVDDIRTASGASYRWVAGFEKAPEWIDPRLVLGAFGGDLESQEREFRKFVDAGAGITRAPWCDAVGSG
jgi:hypothetical protein